MLTLFWQKNPRNLNMNIILLGGWYIQRKPHTWSTAKGCFSCLKNPLKRLAAILCSASQMACYCELLSKKVKKIDAWFLNLMWHSALWDPYFFHIQNLYWIWIFFIKTPPDLVKWQKGSNIPIWKYQILSFSNCT